MRRHRLRRLAGALLIAPLAVTQSLSIVQAGAEPAVPAQTVELGGYTVSARGNGVRVLYDLPGALPIGTLVDVAVPTAIARLDTGPVGHALSAIGYPGPVVLGGEALMAQGGFESPVPFPDYPFAIEASSGGPTEVRDEETVPGGSMHAKADGPTSEAVTHGPANEADPVLSHGGVRTTARSAAATTADAETVVEVVDVVALAGLLRVDSVVSHLRASSDGTEGTSEGSTTVSGATFLGQPVEIGPDGIRFTEPPEPSPVAEALEPLAGQLDPLDDGLAQLLEQFGSLNELLGQAGISIRLAEPRASASGPGAERAVEGLTIDFEQELGATPLAELFALAPVLPDLPGAPVGPNDLIQIVQARQVTSVSIGRAEVATTSSPPFELPELDVDIDNGLPPAAPVALGPSPGGSSAGAPAAGGPPATPGSGSGDAVGPISTDSGLPLTGILGPGTVLAALAGAVILSLGTRKLPDWAMDGTAAGEVCDDVPTDTGGVQ